MSKIKITEHFLSLQGEGKFVGVPSVFVRVFGCNFTCAGFGQPRDNHIPIEEMPHNKFDASGCKSVEDLPVFDIGCDSSAAWNKKYAHLSETYSVDELIADTDRVFRDHCLCRQDRHLVITGGEPLLPKYQKFWAEFITHHDFLFTAVTFETNGSTPLGKELKSALFEAIKTDPNFDVTFSVSPKLSISGEPWEKAINPEAVRSYQDFIDAPAGRGEVYLKFVVRDEECLDDVRRAVHEYEHKGNVYLMPEGATDKGLSITQKEVADLALTYGYFFSPRLHIDLYGNGWGT